MENPIFNRLKAEHPNWSDDQIWTAVSIELQADKTIEDKGEDVNPNDPDIIKSILEGAKVWLKEVLPVIFEKVKVVFAQLLANIKEWVQKGIAWVISNIDKLFRR